MHHMQKNNKPPLPPKEAEGGEGQFFLNIGKIVLLVAVLAAFWYFFDAWLAGK